MSECRCERTSKVTSKAVARPPRGVSAWASGQGAQRRDSSTFPICPPDTWDMQRHSLSEQRHPSISRD
eukprot:COSAG01_NODE_316_length_19004_cov_100.001322_12_plen_68_part_00